MHRQRRIEITFALVILFAFLAGFVPSLIACGS